MRLQSHWGVTFAAVGGLSIPDVAEFFKTADPIIDGFVRLGQVAVAVATVIYIVKKWKSPTTRRRRKK